MVFPLAAISAICALLYGAWQTLLPPSWMRSGLKTMAILALGLVSFAHTGAGFLTLALFASALGDLFLSRPGNRAFLLGMAAFFLGHVFYILLMYKGFSPPVLKSFLPWAVVVAIFACALYALLWKGLGEFKIPVLGYTIVIFLMGVSALGQTGPTAALYLTAALTFMASDAILAVEKFRHELLGGWTQVANHAIWALYYLAQVLFTYTAFS